MKCKLLAILLSLTCVLCLTFALTACSNIGNKDNIEHDGNNEIEYVEGTEGLEYTLNNDGKSYSCTGIGTATETDITIASHYNDLLVIAIGHYAFALCTLTSITIPNSVTFIGYAAFNSCTSLTNITIPDSVTYIEDFAFTGSTLTSISIPDSVTYIGTNAFAYCSSLKAVYITDIASWCNISFGTGTANPLYYAHNLYLNNKLVTELTIPDSVTYIDKFAFFNYISLTSITIPDSVTYIDEMAFGCTSLTSINVSSGNKIYHSEGNCLIETESKILIAGCKNSVIPSDGSVTYIGDYAFRGCTSLTSITIPDSVTYIGYEAFSGCTSLTSITIPDSVTYIGDYAFSDCTSLTSITIPDSVTYIGYEAFSGCTSLKSVTIGKNVTSIDSRAFHGCTSLNAVYIADIANWCNISFGSGAANPLYYAHNLYLNNKLVTELTIPDSVTSIDKFAFFNYISLTSITIPDSVTSIGDYAFAGCSSLSTINFIGTTAQWRTMNRSLNTFEGDYTIYCTDGKISKNGAVTKY